MRIYTEFRWIAFVTVLTVLEILYDESVNSSFKNKKGGTKMADERLNLNIDLGEIPYLSVPDIIDCRLKFITQDFETIDPIW